MVSFDYLINDAMGLHARPVGLVVKDITDFAFLSLYMSVS